MTLWWQSLMETHLCTHREMTIGIVCAHMRTHVTITHEFVAWGNWEIKARLTSHVWQEHCEPQGERNIFAYLSTKFFFLVINSMHSSFKVFSHIYLWEIKIKIKACCSTYVGVRGQLSGVLFTLLPCGFRGLNSGLRPWQRGPLPSAPSHWPLAA